MRNHSVAGAAAFALGATALLVADGDGLRGLVFPDSAGLVQTVTTNRALDFGGPFFQSLGANGRSCGTCHVVTDAWSIKPASIQLRFLVTFGRDPLFRTNDGSNCANADVSTLDKARSAYSLLLNKGLLRVQLPVPAGAEFSIESVDDPYRCASIPGQVSVYRRVLPSTNLRFLSTVMWDGRESLTGNTLQQNLAHQAMDATTGHAQAAAPPTAAQQDAIVAFELGLYTAQVLDFRAGRLDVNGAQGGADILSRQPFFIGINDPLGGNPAGTPFTTVIFNLFDGFRVENARDDGSRARASIARGQELFNHRTFAITNVAGLPSPSITSTCGLCHDTPNVGHHSVTAPLNLGLTDASRRTPDLPLFRLRCTSTNQVIETTDPGRAMISGRCADIGKFKGPILRGIAARPPYFHNGSAATLDQVVDFYNTRFNIGFTAQEKADLAAFLNAL